MLQIFSTTYHYRVRSTIGATVQLDQSKVSIFHYGSLVNSEVERLKYVIFLSSQSKYLSRHMGVSTLEGIENKMAVCYDGVIVGYYTPVMKELEGVKYHRPGLLYLMPEYRGKGIMQAALRMEIKNKDRCIAWVDDANASSIAMFEDLGFIKGPFHIGAGGLPGHWYVLEKKIALENLAPSYVGWK